MDGQSNNWNGNGYYNGTPDGNNPNYDDQAKRNAELAAATSTALHSGFAGMNAMAGTYTAGELDEISDQSYNMIIGAMLLYGFALNAIMCFVFGDQILKLNAATVMIAYIVGVIVGMIICNKTENPVVGFIGYNLIVVPMGLILTPYLKIAGIETVRYAFCVMGVIMMLMIGLAYLYPQFFKSIGRMLFSCLLIGLIAESVMWAFGNTSGVFDFFFVGIFAGYIGFDWAMAQSMTKTKSNAVRCAYMIYVDLINLLIRLIRILAKNRD